MSWKKEYQADKEVQDIVAKIRDLQNKRPGEDVMAQIAKNLSGINVQKLYRSEIENLRVAALSSMGTPGEMSFGDIERGMLRASLSDGREALKDIIENMPVSAPLPEEGTTVRNRGKGKKNS
jgi:hypothetical protein